MKISIEQQISEAEAEISKRHFVYGRLISAGNMRRSEADVLIADPVGERVIACNSNGGGCATFGETDDNFGSNYSDIFFAPQATPTTTTSTTSTTLEEGN